MVNTKPGQKICFAHYSKQDKLSLLILLSILLCSILCFVTVVCALCGRIQSTVNDMFVITTLRRFNLSCVNIKIDSVNSK